MLVSRMLCPECGDVTKVVTKLTDGVVLACGHARPDLLPVKAGCLSVEHSTQDDFDKCFPENVYEVLWHTEFTNIEDYHHTNFVAFIKDPVRVHFPA